MIKREEIMRELELAKDELMIAQRQFDHAVDDYIDIANERLTIAQRKVNLLIKQIRLFERDRIIG